MQVDCPRCSRVLEYSGDRPHFCAYCGQPLHGGAPGSALLATVEYGAGSDPHASPGGGLTEASPWGWGRGPAADEADPDRVAGYRIVRLLGRGGMGSVYEAEDSEFGRRVALKLIASAHVASAEAVERFRQEGRLASTISHPRCVFVLAADEFRGRPYIVMELMPGETLQALVEQRGPLPVGEAVAKMLDVIEGLQEAHHQGVIHRDVKPSNCFLEADGRVKVGDFGLSKSLDSDAGLTRSGAFIGTPLYASPEQIKRDAVDARTDVYSAAATLYYLLTGKPPFQADDAAAALARIVSEPPAPMRKYRPDLPPALESAVLRGLERDRDRRWPDLDRFRRSLLPFVPGALGLSDIALRGMAFAADAALLVGVEWVLVLAFAASAADARQTFWWLGRHTPWLLGAQRLAFLAYFGATEGVWGASLGKRFIRLRVGAVGGAGPPGPARSTARAAVFYAVTALPGDVLTVLLFSLLPGRSVLIYEPLAVALRGAGYLAVVSTMRAGNGFRGLHEWASGTRVGRLPRAGRRRAPRGRRLPDRPDLARETFTGEAGVLRSVGPFRVRGAVRWDADRRVLLGEDPSLRRPVWVVLRPKGDPPPPPGRRDLARPSRPRWLAGGEQAEGRWDAYSAPAGCPLADLAGPTGLPWADARPVLHDLAAELTCACAEGTLPEALGVDQVWVQPDGSVLLADPLGPPPAASPPAPDESRALDLLRKTAVLALQGGRRGGRTPGSIRAVVPAHAGRMLDRLTGRPRRGDSAYVSLAPLLADLEAARDEPTEVDLARRAVHLVPASLASLPLLAAMFLVAYPGTLPRPDAAAKLAGSVGLSQHPTTLLLLSPAVWASWAVLTRGGLLLTLAGLSLVRSDSRPAGRWRCGWRALVAWAPVAWLLAAACHARALGLITTSWAFWALALAAVAVYPVLALSSPPRSVHDRLAGTWLVPK